MIIRSHKSKSQEYYKYLRKEVQIIIRSIHIWSKGSITNGTQTLSIEIVSMLYYSTLIVT